MNRHTTRLKRFAHLPVLLLAMLGTWGESLAAVPSDPGRLFYTPEQRAQLEAARAHNVTQTSSSSKPGGSDSTPPPLRYDGVLIRSDGKTTRWVNGRPQVGASNVSGLKPGQIRADGKVYEPYQVLRPSPAPAIAKEPTP